jgi:ATPase subunit of ABC transporter with duplicated ATPase domains
MLITGCHLKLHRLRVESGNYGSFLKMKKKRKKKRERERERERETKTRVIIFSFPIDQNFYKSSF